MKTNGEWVYDELMTMVLGIDANQFVNLYGGKNSKAMTAAIVAYLQLNYPEKA